LAAGACVLGAAGVIAAMAGSPAASAADPGPLPLPLPSLPLPSLSPLQLPPIQLPPLPAPLPSSIPLPPLPALVFPSAPAAAPAASGLDAYRGLGAWVDLYGYGRAGNPAPEALVAGMAQRGVRTLYVQTARWTSGADIDHTGELGRFLDAAHARGLKVVGWYLGGFGDLGTEVRRSMAVLQFASPSGQRFDGFAADIEDRNALGHDQSRFNNGIAAYAAQLRSAAGAGTTLGAIVPDARNNDRAPAYWAGFPWQSIGANFDVVLPMAYWSVTKNPRTCLSQQMDAAGYLRQVIDETQALMGRSRPMAPAGGVATCDTLEEVTQYVGILMQKGALGGGLYDFPALEARPDRDALWGQLVRLNG